MSINLLSDGGTGYDRQGCGVTHTVHFRTLVRRDIRRKSLLRVHLHLSEGRAVSEEAAGRGIGADGRDDSPAPTSSRGPRLACAGAFAVLVLFKGLVPPDSDTPWHLAHGRMLLHRWAMGDLGLHPRDTFSWAASGVPWRSNAWAFDALLAAFYNVGGWLGVVVLRAGLLGAIVGLSWAVTRHGRAGPWARAGAVWVTAVFILPFSAMRPQLVSFILLLLGLELSGRVFDRDRRPSPGLPRGPRGGFCSGSPVPPLVVLAGTVSLWSSLHGAVVAGVVAITAACIGEAVDSRAWRLPALTAVVAVVGSVLSPLGLSVWSYALRTSGASVKEGIQEWQPPSLWRAEDVVITTLLVVAVAYALHSRHSATNRSRWRHLGPALVLTALAFQAVRNEPLALLALLPFTARMLSSLCAALDRRGWAPRVHPGRALGAMTLGALLGGAIQTGSLPIHANPLSSPRYPRLASALPGGCRLLNEYDYGGYLIFVRPDVPVSQDGRNDLYGSGRLQEQEVLLNERDPEQATAALRRLGVTCVLVRADRGLTQALGLADGWRRTAGDGAAEVWIRTP